MSEKLGIAGAGTIATGLAVVASTAGEVLLWARSPESADRARAMVERSASRTEGADAARVSVVTDLDALCEATFLVEAVAEHQGSKEQVLANLGDVSGRTREETVVATTTSSLSIDQLASASGAPERFVGLHVFNPVPRMKLVELSFPAEASQETRARAIALCEGLGKTPVEVPNIPGFVVNRLLFPYLFSAVDLMSRTEMDPTDIDRCMTLGAGMPMGPFALLDFVGLDVAQAIGEEIETAVPKAIRNKVKAGELGRKTGRGFYDYS